MINKIESLYTNYNMTKNFIPAAKRVRIEKFLRYVETANFMSFEEASAVIQKIIAE